tara:strand:- start:2694 stop:4412 length:1719 start_codon:yes stop_codon:yes gene_type:complete
MTGDEKSLEKLREMSDLFAGTELMSNTQEAIDTITERITKQKGIMSGLLDAVTGKKKSMIPKFETLKALNARRMHMETLNSSKNHDLLIAAGMGLNLQQLLKIAESTTAANAIAEQKKEYDIKFNDRVKEGLKQQGEALLAYAKQEEIVEEENKKMLAQGQLPIHSVHMDKPEKLKKDEMEIKVRQELKDEGIERPSISDPKEIGKVQAILDQIKDNSKVYEMAGNITGKGLDKLDETLRGFYAVSENISFKPLEADWSNQGDVKDTAWEGLLEVKDAIFVSAERQEHLNNISETVFLGPMEKLVEFSQYAWGVFKKFMLYFAAIVLALFILYRTFKLLEPAWEEISIMLEQVWIVLQFLGSIIWEGLNDIKQGFLDGDFFLVLWGLLQVGIAILAGVWTLAWAAMGVIWLGILSAIGRWAYRLVQGGEETNAAIKQLFYVLGGAIVLIGALMVSWPLILAGIIIMALGGVVDKIGQYFFGYADGGLTKGGLVKVGERGEELIRLPKGTRVHSNVESKRMMADAGGNTTNVTVQVQGRVGASDAEIKDIANKVAREINLRMNRTGAAVTKFG